MFGSCRAEVVSLGPSGTLLRLGTSHAAVLRVCKVGNVEHLAVLVPTRTSSLAPRASVL